MAEESFPAGLPRVVRPDRRHHSAHLRAQLVPGTPPGNRGKAWRRIDPHPLPGPVRQQRHGGGLPTRSGDCDRAWRVDRRVGVLMGHDENHPHPGTWTPHHVVRPRGRVRGLDGHLEREPVLGGSRVQRRRGGVSSPRHRSAGDDRHRQRIRHHLAGLRGQRRHRFGARHPDPQLGCGARRRPDLRPGGRSSLGALHRQPQQRRLPVDRKPVRQSERHGFDAELSLGCVRPERRAVNRCRASGAGPLRLLRRPRHNRGGLDPAEGRHISLFLPRQPLRGRPWSWITGRPRLTDRLVVAFNLLFGTGALIASYVHAHFAWFGVVLLLVETLPLWWRRRFPVAVLAVVLCAEIARWALQLSNEPSGPALVFAVYAVSVYGQTRERLLVAGAAIAVIALAVTLLLFGQFPVSRSLIPAGSTSLVAWVIGDYMRSRRQFFIALAAALDLSAYRIIQEAVTNVLKHANATRIELSIDYQPQSLVIAVSDNGSGATETVGGSAGHGLIGMRERAELFDGELGTGSSSLGGFTVRAKLHIN